MPSRRSEHKPHSTQELVEIIDHDLRKGGWVEQDGERWRVNEAGLVALQSLVEQFEVLKQAAQDVEMLAFRQYLDWMHFHELAMAKPFEAETEAQDFARRVSSLLTLALGSDSTIEVLSGDAHPSNPATKRSLCDMTHPGEPCPASEPKEDA